jgi:DNA primase large subunit
MTTQQKPRTIPFNVLCKYPFLNESIAWVQEKNVTPIEALYNHITMLEKIRALISDALDNKEQTKALGYDDDEGLYIYPWIRIILAFMNMPRLTHKVGNLLSKHFSNLLEHENDFTVLVVARDQAINAEQVPADRTIAINTVSFPYRLAFLDFLNVAARFKAQAWKLVNKLLQSGQVYLRKHDLVRMLEEIIKLKVIEPSAAASDETLKDAFATDPLLKPFYDSLTTAVKEKMASSSVGSIENLPVDESAFPPCINAIIDKNARGVNLAHSERLFLVYFLLTIGKTVDEVLDLFRNQPDYNEKITKYQVEFAAGRHGKQTQYKPHNCVTLESISVCKKDDPKFGSKSCTEPKTPFKNPLTFYRRKTWYKAKKASETAAAPVDDDDPGVDPAGTATDARGGSNTQRT